MSDEGFASVFGSFLLFVVVDFSHFGPPSSFGPWSQTRHTWKDKYIVVLPYDLRKNFKCN